MTTTYYHSIDGEILGETTAGVRTDYQSDALGSVVETVSAAAELNAYRYTAYGFSTSKSGTAADPRCLWVGTPGYRTTTMPTVGHYVRARHYSASSANWTSVDPLWPDENPYGYVYGAPTTDTDEYGLGEAAYYEVVQPGKGSSIARGWESHVGQEPPDCGKWLSKWGHLGLTGKVNTWEAQLKTEQLKKKPCWKQVPNNGKLEPGDVIIFRKPHKPHGHVKGVGKRQCVKIVGNRHKRQPCIDILDASIAYTDSHGVCHSPRKGTRNWYPRGKPIRKEPGAITTIWRRVPC